MNEWLKKVLGKIKELWSKWKPIQKVILIAIVLVVIVAVIVAARFSAKPATYRVFTQPITDEATLTRISDRIDEEHIPHDISNGVITVADEKTAKKLQTLLVSENLVPSYVDPFEKFYKRDWSTTDSDQIEKLNKALQNELRDMVRSIDGIRDAAVIIVRPGDKLFAADQRPVSASVKLYIDSRSDFESNRKKILGVQRLILSAVEGLAEENLVITNAEGIQINDFEGMAESDRIDLVAKQQRQINKMEIQKTGEILESLQGIFTDDRIRNLNVKLDMDMSHRTTDSTEYSPIVIRPDNPDTPYDDSEFRDTLPVSEQRITKDWQGMAAMPEGPAGVEGQTPAVYADMSNYASKSTETGVTVNNVINTKHTSEVSSPKPDRWSVSVNVDGTWKTKKDAKTGRPVLDEYGSFVRDYIPPTEQDLRKVREIIEGAIGYDRNRGDVIRVTDLQIDRTKQFKAEEDAYFAKLQRRTTILFVLIAVAVVLVGFILFRVISREIERRRREREARLLAEQQAARERALWDAKEDGMEVTMSVEETRRMELQENAINMAKEHPEDVAMLIRTWLMEE
ncbi:MAG: flagellar basal-body MS-ring/collar protein FliF [Treponema sp.]|nr:flagellar M-ring protein FliF [Spirochaetia bacterium]MDY2841029.1 flagellar basal-body MS-ring/collar protein FliF [Treponema sp.]